MIVLKQFFYRLAILIVCVILVYQAVHSTSKSNYSRSVYDALNRLTVEDACETGSRNDYGYTGQYVYDLAGNRRSRNVTVTYYQDPGNPVREQRISTSYSYYSDDNGETDRLHTESHSITQISLVMPDEQIYLYASNGGEFHYTKGLDGKRLSQVHAMLLGLPTKLGSRLFYVAMALVVAAFFAPVIASGYIKLRKCQPESLPVNLSLYHRCVLVFLAYALLVGPFGFEQLSHADIQYQDLLASDWGTDGEIITYTYDRNGSIETKVVNDGGPEVTYTNEYNLRNRLAKLTKSTSGQSSEHVTEYKYNPEGIRVCAYSYDTTDGGQTRSNEKTIDYLIDAYNHTGYAQTLVEDNGTDKTTYIIGSDVLAQATNSNNPEYLLYDGHGSTRQLLASNGSTVSDSFSYDAYGVMLGGNPQTPAGTNLLYAGEHFDSAAQNYYLRARLYNPNNGRFNRRDSFVGNNRSPQSLHKYLYAHCNPTNALDLSGYYTNLVEQPTVQKTQAEVQVAQTVNYAPVALTATQKIGSALLIAAITFWAIWTVLDVFSDDIDLEERTLPSMYEKFDTREKLKTAIAHVKTAEQIVSQFADKIGIRAREFGDLPIFFVFKSLTPYIYEHDKDAIAGNPLWFALQYLGAGNEALRRQNYLDATRGMHNLIDSENGLTSLDEYPFASTFQGGAGASVAPVPPLEQSTQGGLLRWFYEQKLLSQPRWFLVVPVPI